MGNATNVIDDFYGKASAFIRLSVSSLPSLPNNCECGSTEFILTELLYERSSQVVFSETSDTLIGYTNGFTDYSDHSAVSLFICKDCDTAYSGTRTDEIEWY